MNKKSKLEYSILNGSTGLLSQFVIIILGFITRTVFIEYLGSELLGINGTFTNIISILSVTELGIGSTITYCLYKPVYDDDKEKIAGIINLLKKAYFVVGSIILIGSIILTPFIQYLIKDYTYDINYIRIIFILYALNSTVTYFVGYYRIMFIATQRNYVVTLVDFVTKILLNVAQLIVLIFTQNFIIYLLMGLLSNLISNYIIRKKYYKDYSFLVNNKTKIDTESKKKIYETVKYLSLSSIISIGVFGTDNLIISAFIGVGMAGVYSNYAMIIANVQNLFTSLLNGTTASFGNMMAEGNKEKINNIFDIYDFAYFLVATFTSVSLFNMLNPFINDIWIKKEGYLLSVLIVAILVINNYLTFKRQPVWQFQNTAGIFKYFIPYSLAELIINLVISIILAIKVGLIGVFIGTLVAYSISWIGQIFVLHKRVLEKKPTNYLIKQIVYFLLAIVELLLVKYLAQIPSINNGYFSFIYVSFLCLIIPNGLNILIFHKTKEFKYLKDNILNKIFHK